MNFMDRATHGSRSAIIPSSENLFTLHTHDKNPVKRNVEIDLRSKLIEEAEKASRLYYTIVCRKIWTSLLNYSLSFVLFCRSAMPGLVRIGAQSAPRGPRPRLLPHDAIKLFGTGRESNHPRGPERVHRSRG